MQNRRIEFRVALPADAALRLAEDALCTAGWRVTGEEEQVVFGARSGSFAYPIGIELKVTPLSEAESAIRCTAWTRVGSLWQRRQINAHLRRVFDRFAVQAQVEPAAPVIEALEPRGGTRPWWAFWRT